MDRKNECMARRVQGEWGRFLYDPFLWHKGQHHDQNFQVGKFTFEFHLQME
jgi:hypothetical protein